MSKDVVAVDVDGVLCDFVGGVMRRCRDVGIDTPRDEEIGSKHLLSYFSQSGKLDAIDLIGSRGFAMTLPVLDGAQEEMLRLRMRFDVVFVTAPWPSPTWCWDRTLWLAANFDALASDVVLCKSRRFVRACALVDDYPPNAKSFAGDFFLIAQPWNSEEKTMRRMSLSSAVDELLRRETKCQER